jgi:glycosyltransferase involved in cell wall biosynthesis
MQSNENLPTVSIVIPCHNHQEWVQDAIISAASNTYPNKRIIFVDDGSTDASWQLVCALAGLKPKSTDGNVIYTSNILGTEFLAYRFTESRGPSVARNLGIKIMWQFTDLFAFLDSDDVYTNDKIEKSVDKYLLDPIRIGVIYSDFDTINVQTGVRVRQYKEPFNLNRLRQECIINNDSVVSKAALEKAGFYDEEMRTCEDYDLWMRISDNHVFIHIPESLVLIRVGKHSSTNTVSQDVWNKNWQRVMDKLYSRLSNEKA